MTEDKKPLSDIEYQFGILRQSFLELQEKVISKLMEFETLRKKIDAKLALADPLASINVKKLAQLKQLGINPKDLLSSLSSLPHEEKKERA